MSAGRFSAAEAAAVAPDDSEMREIRWRCRRGMRELDVLLTRWLERRWEASSPELRRDFCDLLNSEDDLLWDWLLGRSVPPDESLRRIVGAIRSEPEYS